MRSPVVPAACATAACLATIALFLFLAGQRPATVARAPEPPRGGGDLAGFATALRPLHRELPPPRPGDWRAGPGENERGQTYAAWRRSTPTNARGQRSVIYVLPIGEFSPARRELLTLTQEFLGLYFGLVVRQLPRYPVDERWPEYARRRHPTWGGKQLLSTHVLREVLPPLLPDDGAVLIGLTQHDLWPGRGWNFVFGQASLRDRVGVWSLNRFGNPANSRRARLRALRRTLKVATHETGHMFSMDHCTAYLCNMCGSNHLEEADLQPLHLCPECLPKLWAATGTDPRVRFRNLATFCARHGLEDEAAFYARSLRVLRSPRTSVRR